MSQRLSARIAGSTRVRKRDARRLLVFSISQFLIVAGVAVAQPPIVRQVAAPGPAADAALDIQATVDQFRLDVGGPDNGNTFGSAGAGRREIDWDDVPEGSASPASLPVNYYNQVFPRGAILSGAATFQVCASTNGDANFGNLNPNYPTAFGPFSVPRFFSPIGDDQVVVEFFVPSTATPATVNGFGAVFIDVDLTSVSEIEYFDASGSRIFRAPVPAAPGNQGMSFLGVTFPGSVVRWVRITCGTGTLFAFGTLEDVTQGGATDLVVLDDFIFGEPIPTSATGGMPPTTGGGGTSTGGGGVFCGAGVAMFAPAIGLFLVFGVRVVGGRRR